MINSEFVLFADDSKLLRCVNANGHNLLNDDFQRIIAWSILHGLPLRVKCFVFHYAGRHEPNPSVHYCINNVPIASVTNCAE